MEQKEKNYDKQLLIEKAKYDKIQEKLTQERGWKQKEEEEMTRKNKETQQFKEDLIKSQENFSKEHMLVLKLDNELKEARVEIAGLNDQRRDLESQNAQLKAKNDNHRSEIIRLKKDLTELTQKREDTAWVAKSEFEDLKKVFNAQKAELENLKRKMPGA